MEITKETKLIEILKEYPWFADLAKKLDSRFAIIDTPIGKALARKYSIADVAKMGNLEADKIIEEIHRYIEEYNKNNNNQ